MADHVVPSLAVAVAKGGQPPGCCGVDAHAATQEKNLFELKKVADGVYAAFAGPAYKVNSNAAVILTNNGAVVVDTHSKPSAAAALYKEIQGVTKNPVKKIVNTHFHWDHWQGNEVYRGAYSALEIIASEQTRQNMTKPDAGVGGIPHIERQIATLPAEIEKLKEEAAKTSDAAAKARVDSNLRQAETYLEELKKIKPAPPTRGVPGGATKLLEGGREIQLHVVGRAHTDGDVFVYLPKEKVLVTGDAVATECRISATAFRRSGCSRWQRSRSSSSRTSSPVTATSRRRVRSRS
jgi:cyclase